MLVNSPLISGLILGGSGIGGHLPLDSDDVMMDLHTDVFVQKGYPPVL